MSESSRSEGDHSSPQDEIHSQSPNSADSDSVAATTGSQEKISDAGRPKQKRSHRRRAVVGTAVASAVVLLAAAAITFVVWERVPPAPVQAVESFLESAREMDVDAAVDHIAEDDQLGLVSADGTHEGVLMFDENSPGTEWEIEETELVNHDLDQAKVDVTIAAPDGTRVRDTFDLVDEGEDDWKLEDPYTMFEIPSVWSDHIEVNGQSWQTDPEIEYPWIYFLPGVYEYYGSGLDFIETKYDAVIKLGDSSAAIGVDDNPEFTFGFRAGSHEYEALEELYELSSDTDIDEQMQPHIEAYVEQCIESQNEDRTTVCSELPVDLLLRDGLEEFDVEEDSVDRDSVEWSVSEYPTMAADFSVAQSDDNVLNFTIAEAGEVDITVSDAETPEDTYSFQCSLHMDSFGLGFDAAGDINVDPVTELPRVQSFDLLEDGVDCTDEE